MASNEIDTALSNLSQIKNGTDPRGTAEFDPLAVARDEVHRLYTEELPSRMWDRLSLSSVHVGVARWERKNGICKYNTRLLKPRHGKRVQAVERGVTGEHSILANERIFEEGNEDGFIDTVRHEFAHVVAYVDGQGSSPNSSPGHGPAWKTWARELGADPSSCHNRKSTEYNYWYGCPNGCWSSGRIRKSKKVKNAYWYSCGECGDTCVSWEDGDPRPTEPGTTVPS